MFSFRRLPPTSQKPLLGYDNVVVALGTMKPLMIVEQRVLVDVPTML